VLVAKRFYPDMLQACFPVMKPLSQNSPVLILSAEPMNSIHINLDELSQHQLSFFPLNADYAWITSKIHELLSQQDTTRKPLQIPPEICQSIALLEKLSKRELEILGFIGQGLSNREISLELTLSEHSVRTHVYNIFTKLSLKRRSQAVLVDIYRKTNDVSA
jgi:ATP/maltotriose-dependent transcriptional regulator MalT